MNQYLIDNDDILFDVFKDQNHPFIKNLYSRYEEYALYKGLNRSKTNPFDKYNFATLYIRADTKKTEIKRTYQNLLEFYADVSSLLLGIFRFLIIVFDFINNFYVEYSFAKRIFIFKEFENSHFNISKRYKQLNQLKLLINNYNEQNTDINSFNSDLDSYLPNEKIFGNFECNTYNKIKKKEINISNEYNKRNSIPYSNQIMGNVINDGNNSRSKLSSGNIKNEKPFSSNNSTIDKGSIKKIGRISDSISLENTINKVIVKNNNYKYNFNIFEIISINCFKCCLTKQLKFKNNAYNIISNILSNKLDIVLYIKNIFISDIINKTLLNPKSKDVFNFLYHPVITVEQNNKNHFSDISINFNENDFDKFYEGIVELVQKDEKTEKEKNIIYLSQQKLVDLC